MDLNYYQQLYKMKKRLLLLLCFALIFSCSENIEEEEKTDKWGSLEMDIRKSMDKIIENHKSNWGDDQYNVMGAIEEIMEGLFQKVQIR